MDVSRSRYTPGLKNGSEVRFSIGENVLYQLRTGEKMIIRIITERLKSKCGKYFGYEAIYSDDGHLYFAVDQGIIDWDGKPD